MSEYKKFRVWDYKDYVILIFGRTFQTFSYQIMAVIIGWHLYTLKSDPLWLGLLGLAEAIPAIISSIFTGYLVDTRKPASLLKFSFLATALNALNTFIFILLGPAFFSSATLIFILFLSVFITGAVRSLTSPSQSSLLTTMIPREYMAQATALNSSSYTFAQIVGPAMGGILYSATGPAIAFAFPFIFSLAAFLLIFRISPQVKDFQPHGIFSEDSMWKIIAEGVLFLRKQKTLLSAMILDMFSVLFGGAVAVLPVFADKVFHVSADGLGYLRAAPALGSVLMSFILSIHPLKIISGKILLRMVFSFGLCMIGFAFSKNFYLAMFWLFLSGIFDSVSMVIRGTLVQLLTPQKLIGRVTSLSRIFITSSNEIGAFESGLAASYMGLIPSVVFGGVMTIIVVLAINRWDPELNKTQLTH